MTEHSTKLHIGAGQTTLSTKIAGTDKNITLAIGYRQLAETCFTVFPPYYDAIDHAINITEEILAPFQKTFSDSTLLQSHDDWLRQTAELAFNTRTTPNGEIRIPRIELENVFNRLAEIVKGLPASQDVLPEDNDYAAYLLIIREIMHHLNFQEVACLPPHQ